MSFLDDMSTFGSWIGDLFSSDSGAAAGDAAAGAGEDYYGSNGMDLASDIGETQSSDLADLGGSAGDAGAAFGSGMDLTGSAEGAQAAAPAASTGGGGVQVSRDVAGPTTSLSPISASGAVHAGQRAASGNSGTSWLQRLMAGDKSANSQAQMAMLGLGLVNSLFNRGHQPNAAGLRDSMRSPYDKFTPVQQGYLDRFIAAPTTQYRPPAGGYVGHRRGGPVGGLTRAKDCGCFAAGGPVAGGYGSIAGPGSNHQLYGGNGGVAMGTAMMGGPGASTNHVLGAPSSQSNPGLPGPGGPTGVMPMNPGGPTGVMPTNPAGSSMLMAGAPAQPNSPLAILRNKQANPNFDASQFAQNHPNFASNHPYLFSSTPGGPDAGAPINGAPPTTMPMPYGGGPQNYAMGGFVHGDAPGQADNMLIKVSPGEYVVDADTVASLGDGNNAAGAKALDQMRHQIRGMKRSGPANDIPPPMRGGALSVLRRKG